MDNLSFDEIWALLPDIIDVPFNVNNAEMKARLFMSKHGIYYAYLDKHGRVAENGGSVYSFYGLPPIEAAKSLVKVLKHNNIID